MASFSAVSLSLKILVGDGSFDKCTQQKIKYKKNIINRYDPRHSTTTRHTSNHRVEPYHNSDINESKLNLFAMRLFSVHVFRRHPGQMEN